MHRSSTRLPDLVETYFRSRGTYPILLSYKNHLVTQEMVEDVQNDLFATFHRLSGVTVITTERVRGEHWTGALIELSDEHYEAESVDMLAGEGNSCTFPAMDVHLKYVPDTQRPQSGFASGESVYPASCLKALGRQYFQTNCPRVS